MKPGLLIVVSGPAGVGKGTVIKKLKELSDGVVLSISATTRTPRPGEVEGVNYFYKTREAFEKMIEERNLIEWVDYCGNYYGTPRDFVCAELEKGNNVVLEIEVQGSLKIRNLFPESILCFIVPPSFDELEKRLRERKTEDDATIERRLERAKTEFTYLNQYDYLIVNDTIDQAAEMLSCIIHAEQMKPANSLDIIESFKNL